MPKTMKWFLSVLLVFNCSFLFSQKDYWSYLVYFGGFPVNHIAKGISIPNNDKKSRMIINAIIEGSSYDNLKQKYPDSLDIKLEKLISGRVIDRTSNGFKFLFPVLVGDNRTKLETIIHKKIAESKITLDSMVFALKNSLGENPDIIFHFIWSRILMNAGGIYITQPIKPTKALQASHLLSIPHIPINVALIPTFFLKMTYTQCPGVMISLMNHLNFLPKNLFLTWQQINQYLIPIMISL
jgi:hypothetical protein